MNSNVIIYTLSLLLIPLVLLKQHYIYRKGLQQTTIHWTLSLIIAFILTVIVRGLAYDTGADWLAYYGFVVDASKGVPNYWAEHSEWFFKETVTALCSLGLWHCTFFVLVSALIVYSLMKISSLYGKAMPYIIIAWYPIMFLLSLNIYRQYIAISLLYLGVFLWLNNKRKVAFTCTIVAVLFHTSAVAFVAFALAVVIMVKKEINVWIYITIIFFCNIATQFFLDRFLNLTAGFSSVFQMGNSNVYDIREFSDSMYGTTYTWILMLVNSVCVYFSNKIKNKYDNYIYFHYAAIISYILYPICQQELMSRILLYVQMFVPVSLGVLYVHYKKQKGLPFVLICLSYITYFTMFFYYLNNMGENHPYRILWDKY